MRQRNPGRVMNSRRKINAANATADALIANYTDRKRVFYRSGKHFQTLHIAQRSRTREIDKFP